MKKSVEASTATEPLSADPVPIPQTNLAECSDANLKRFVSTFGIKGKPSRDALIRQATFLSLTDPEIGALKAEHAEFVSKIETFPPSTKPLPQTIYGREFNKVDQSDRRTMEVYGSGKRMNWKMSCLMALVSFQLASAGSWYEEHLTIEKGKKCPISMRSFLETVMYPAWKTKFNIDI